ncbi:MAG TPA: hypothetical protein VKF15_06035 [Nitrososphaerales archaeon]|nr:hypothetical protein [Nitrososphaerales archaeon]
MSDDRPGAVTAPTLVTGTYQTQYYLTLASAFDTPTGQGWYNAGTPATFRITSTTVSGPTGERFVFSGWTSSDPHGYTGGAANNTATMDNPISENATWTTQYYLTVSSPHGTTSGGGWYDAGSRANFSVAPHTVLGNATTRYVFVGWNTGDNGTVVMNGPVNETAVWSTEYLVNLYQSGSGVAPSVNYTVNGVPGTALVPSSVWALNGSELEFAYQGVVPGSSGMRYVLTGADHTSPLTMGGPLNITAHYKTQFLVKFVASGCAISVVPPANEWVDSGRPATGVFDPTVASGLTRCLFTGDNRPSNITVQTTVTGSYQTQYYLAIISAHDTPTGQGWYNASATASFGVTTPADQSAGTRYVFSAWSSGDPGGYSGANPSASVTVDNPINETASWVTEYYLNVTSAHGTTSGAGWYDAGVNALFGVSPTTVNGSPGVRYVLQGWLPGGMGNVTMLGPVNEVAQWATQYYVQYAQTGCTLAVTVPAGWVDSGGAVPGSFPSPVSGIATQCLFLGDDRPVTVEAPTTVNGTYKTQFTLALSTPYGTALGGGWYDKGSNASFDVSPTTVGTFVFTAWEGSPGGYTGPDHSASAIMDAPINETAEWTAMSTTTTSTSTSSLTSTNSTTTITTTLSSNTTTAASTTSTSTTTVTATNSSTASSTSSTTTVTTTVTATNSTTSTGSSSTTTVTSTISPTTSSSTTTITTTTTTIVVVPSTTVVNCVPSSAVVGSRIKCDATVTGSSPTGVVTWSASGSGRFSGPTCRISNGTCGVTFTPTAGGASVTITGSYGGNVHNSPSSGRFILRVTAKASRTAVSCKPASTLAGSSQVIRCTAVVKGYFPTGTVAWSQVGGTGSVSFTTDVCNLGQGRCFVTMRAVNAGSVTILGRYTGDGNNQGSSMNGVLVIHPVKPRLAVSCTSSSMNVGSEVTCTATLAGYTGSVTGEEVIWAQVSGPGRVSFSRVECALSAAGSCSMSVKGLSPGGLQFKAFYVGDQNNLRSAVAHNLTVKRA